jgi:hypothetical protein
LDDVSAGFELFALADQLSSFGRVSRSAALVLFGPSLCLLLLEPR